MNTKERMQRARGYIQTQDYARARQLLKDVNHPTAQQWLARIDAIAPTPKRTWLKAAVILTLIGAVLLATVIAFSANQDSAALLSSQTSYALFCRMHSGYSDQHCNGVARDAITTAEDVTVFQACADKYSYVSETDHFALCLDLDGVAIP